MKLFVNEIKLLAVCMAETFFSKFDLDLFFFKVLAIYNHIPTIIFASNYFLTRCRSIKLDTVNKVKFVPNF